MDPPKAHAARTRNQLVYIVSPQVLHLPVHSLPPTNSIGSVGGGPICALSVEYHMQRFGYIRSRSHMLYLYVFNAGLNKHDIVLRLLLSRKSHQEAAIARFEDRATERVEYRRAVRLRTRLGEKLPSRGDANAVGEGGLCS